jgi:hypothetical protein
MDIFNKFVEDIERFLNVRAQKTSVTQLWNQYCPVEARGGSLAEWLHKDVSNLYISETSKVRLII